MIQNVLNRFIFLHRFFHSPKYVGSVTPSSTFLATKMLEDIEWDQIDILVEFGAGTGVFTEQIKNRKNPNTKVIIFEMDDEMRIVLKRKYPDFLIYPNAGQLKEILQRLNIDKVDVIVSGLPFANFPQSERVGILQTVYDSLKPGGSFIQFQYTTQLKKLLSQYFDVQIDFVLFNIPPAFVYTCKKVKKEM